MRNTLLILLASAFHVLAGNSYSQTTKLSLDMKNTTIQEVLSEIEKESNFYFLYNGELIDVNRQVTISVKDESIENILLRLFSETGVNINIRDNHIVLTPKLDQSSSQQSISVSGKVTDSSGTSLPGVTVVVKGTTQGTITDADGTYSLANVQGNATLVFSFIGMKTQEIAVLGKTTINVKMAEEAIGIGEVVAIGYGEQSRSRVTSSISKVDPEVLENATLSNVGSALQGSVSGLRVINTTGQPGATPNILLRGGASLSDPSAPLVVVDGVIRSIADINANDIESISILKDAASTAVYGARANGGVVLVTTKQGKVGKSNLTYTFKFGVNARRNDYDLVTAEEYIYYQRMGIRYTNESRSQGGVAPINVNNVDAFGFRDPDNYDIALITNANRSNFSNLLSQGWQWMLDPYTDNQDTIVYKDYSGIVANDAFNEDPTTQEHNLAFSGGNDRGTFFSSINYYTEDGLGKDTKYKRFSWKLNSSYKLSDNFEISGGFVFSNSATNSYLTSDNFHRARVARPTFIPYDEDGNPNPGTNKSYGNPAYYADKILHFYDLTRLTFNSGFNWEIIPGLNLIGQASLYQERRLDEGFTKEIVYSTGAVDASRGAGFSIDRNIQQQHNVTLDYKKTIDKHNFNMLVGGEYYDMNQFSASASGKDAPTDDIYTLNASPTITKASSSRGEGRMMSGFGRLIYNFDEKYLFTGVLRYDGTSLLENNRWGAFPGMSAGWNMHKEDFFKSSSLSAYVSSLKPRISYGVNGNIAGVKPYEVQGLYGATTKYDGTSSYKNSSIINTGLRWERSKSLDVGVEVGLLDQRIFLNLGYFRRVTDDLLTNLALPKYTGFSSFRTNLGDLENKGFEGEMNIRIVRNPNGFSWDFGGNVTYVKNKILKLPDNGVENNRQGGQEIYDPASGGLVWVGGYQEGGTLGDIVAFKAERILKDWADVQANVANRYDAVAQLYGPQAYSEISNKKGKYPIEPGDVLWKDFDGNDIIDSRDRYVVGNIYPKWTGGFSSSMSYKNFSLDARFDYAIGHTIYNAFKAYEMSNAIGGMTPITLVRDTWTPENPDAKYPVFLFADYPKLNIKRVGSVNDIDSHSDQVYEKGDYLAVREVTLSYSLPQSILKKLGVSSVLFHVTGQNLAYLTKYSGWAPESGGTALGRYPLPRKFIFGLKVSFL